VQSLDLGAWSVNAAVKQAPQGEISEHRVAQDMENGSKSFLSLPRGPATESVPPLNKV